VFLQRCYSSIEGNGVLKALLCIDIDADAVGIPASGISFWYRTGSTYSGTGLVLALAFLIIPVLDLPFSGQSGIPAFRHFKQGIHTPCTSTLLAMDGDTPCMFTLLVVERYTPCTSILLAVERDTPCTSILLAVERDTPCTSILLAVEG
jgi:hypothetical protein